MVKYFGRNRTASFNKDEQPLKTFMGISDHHCGVYRDGEQGWIEPGDKIFQHDQIGDAKEVYCDTVDAKAKRKGLRNPNCVKKFLINDAISEEMDLELDEVCCGSLDSVK